MMTNTGGHDYLVDKAVSVLLAMGNDRPKTLPKLTNTLNIRQCTNVTPFINPFDALDIVNKLSGNHPPIASVHSTPKQVLVTESEADLVMWHEAETMATITGRLNTIATEGSVYFKSILHQISSWINQNPHGSKTLLLEEFARRSRLFADCDSHNIVCCLQNLGVVTVAESDSSISYDLPSNNQEMKLILSNHQRNRGSEVLDQYSLGLIDKRKSTDSNADTTDGLHSEADILGFLKVLVILCSMSTVELPSTMKDLHSLVVDNCKVMYLVAPSTAFSNDDVRKCMTVKKTQNKRRQAELHFAIGVTAEKDQSMEISPEGFLGISQKSSTEESTDNRRDDHELRLTVETHGKNFAKAMKQLLTYFSQKRGTTLVEANSAEKKEMVENLANWVESFESCGSNKSEEQMDGDDATSPSKLPTRRFLQQQLIKLCIGQTRDAGSPSSLVTRLQEGGWITVDTKHPYQVSYNLTAIRENSTNESVEDQIEKSLMMMFVPFMNRALPEVTGRESDDCKNISTPYSARNKRRYEYKSEYDACQKKYRRK